MPETSAEPRPKRYPTMRNGRPIVRVGFKVEDLEELADQLDGWDHPIYWKIRQRLSEAQRWLREQEGDS